MQNFEWDFPSSGCLFNAGVNQFEDNLIRAFGPDGGPADLGLVRSA